MPAQPAAPELATALCEVGHVSRDFLLPDGSALRVLDDVSLAVHPHEVVAILGPSGCGKSTVLRVLAGLLPPTSGEVLYHGEPLRGLSPGVAIVFQGFALFPWMTVRESAEAGPDAAGVAPSPRRARCGAASRLV